VSQGGQVTIAKSDPHIFTSRKLGGMGTHRVATALQFKLLHLTQQTLLHATTVQSATPLDCVHALTTTLITQYRRGVRGNVTYNHVHNYVQLVTVLGLDTPITGQQPITNMLQPAVAPCPWQVKIGGKQPHMQPTDYALTQEIPRMKPAIDSITTWRGNVIYTDGSAKDGNAGAGFYDPSLGASASRRVTGMQTSGRAELSAALGAIDFHKQHLPNDPLLIITDYYTLADRWPRLEGPMHHKLKLGSLLAKAPNRDLWYELSGLYNSRITIVWAPGHSKLHGNEAADRLAKAGTSLPLPRTPWQPDHWRLYHKSAEVHQDLMQFIHSKQPKPLTWSTSDINFRLSFGSLGQRGHVTRLTWLWGRTSWRGTKGYWERDTNLHCNACPQGSQPHHLDLFSTLAHCPSSHLLRQILIWSLASTCRVRGAAGS
jgi:ribonuclease HI